MSYLSFLTPGGSNKLGKLCEDKWQLMKLAVSSSEYTLHQDLDTPMKNAINN